MNCKEAQKLIPQYMDDSMDKDTLLEFMSHIRECYDCYDELNTFFMVKQAMLRLEQKGNESFDLQNLLNQDLNRKWQLVNRHETHIHLTVFFGILVLIFLVWIILDMYGIVSLSYLL